MSSSALIVADHGVVCLHITSIPIVLQMRSHRRLCRRSEGQIAFRVKGQEVECPTRIAPTIISGNLGKILDSSGLGIPQDSGTYWDSGLTRIFGFIGTPDSIRRVWLCVLFPLFIIYFVYLH